MHRAHSDLDSSSMVSSGTSDVSADTSLRSLFFELMYLTSSPSKLFWVLSLFFLGIDSLQILSFATDRVFGRWTLAPWLQDGLSLTRVTILLSMFEQYHLAAVLGVAIVAFLVLFCGVCYLSARAIQHARVPNIMLVRFIRLTLICLTTFSFIPVFSVLVHIAVTDIALSASLNTAMGLAAAVIAIIVTGTITLTSLTSYPFGFTSSNPLSRQHSRIDIMYLAAKAVTVLLFQLPAMQARPKLLGAWMLVFILVHIAAYGVIAPYYRITTNMARVLTVAVMLAGLGLYVHWSVALVLLLLSPLAALLPLAAVGTATLLTMKFRAAAIAEEDLDAAVQLRPVLLAPLQVELALRLSRRRIRCAKARVAKIKKAVPMTLLEYGGGVDEEGALDTRRLSPDQHDDIAQAEATIKQEVRFGMRLFTVARARWPRSSYLAMTYVLFCAAYRGDTLQSAIHSTGRAMQGAPWAMDSRYFSFIAHRYRSALYEDSSVITKLEAQRNMATLIKSQRKLADALNTFWTHIADNQGTGFAVSHFKPTMRVTKQIATLLGSTERLYKAMLAAPTPRIVRSYAQYVQLFSTATGAYTDQLYGIADELEVAPGSGPRSGPGPVPRLDIQGGVGVGSFKFFHIRAVASTVLILGLFAVSVLACEVVMMLYSHIVWESFAISSLATGLQFCGLSYAAVQRDTVTAVALTVATAEVAGATFSSIINERGQEYIEAAATMYAYGLQLYVAGDLSMFEDPYAVIADIDQTVLDRLGNTVVVGLTHALYNLPDLLATTTLLVPTVTGGAHDGGWEEVSLLSEVSGIIHTIESLAACVMEKTAAGSSTPATDCFNQQVDTIIRYELAIVGNLFPALSEVSERVFIVTQVFPLLELVSFGAIFVLLMTSVLVVSVTLYIVPMTRDISSSVGILTLFSSVPEETLSAVVSRVQLLRTRRADPKPASTDSPALQPTPATRTAVQTPVGLTHTVDFGATRVIDSDLSMPVTAAQSSSSESDSDASVVLNQPMTFPEASTALSLVEVADTEADLVDAVALGDTDAVMLPNKPLVRGAGHIKAGLFRGRMGVRQLPTLSLWMALFAAVYLTMCGYVLYRSGGVSQTASTLFYQYQSAIQLRHGLVALMSTTVSLSSTYHPTNMTFLRHEFDAIGESTANLIPHLNGYSVADDPIFESAWAQTGWSAVKRPATTLSGLIVMDSWVDGANEDDITGLLYSDECIRLSDFFCVNVLLHAAEAQHGLIMATTSYLASFDELFAAIIGGTFSGASYAQKFILGEVDVYGGIVRVTSCLRDRLSAEVGGTMVGVGAFLCVFCVVLALFYGLYLFRTIVNISRTRRHFGVLYRSLPRDGLPANLVEAFQEVFPDEN
ncbi:tmcB-like protein [Carpediemonas membranifera]|uniref:TmcB-like protein n=1 Tax=Carpediemonas membranifera TaxID=201153 RepID=A0A8J6AXP3_9EUKA|nr:tmcB-like protein [Carpediemonas membranifera]|eukprot:KAG9395045.1 tmcB-like protein [Carpediemonas membranifera]